MPTLPSPVYNNTNAPVGIGSGFNSTASVDRLRQYMIFEMVNVNHDSASVPQSTAIFPYLVMHINPSTFQESYTKLVTRQATRGGFVEQYWGEELDAITCSGSTGAFVTIGTGLSVLNRKASIAYRKYLDLLAAFKNNGLVYDQRGGVVFTGGINLHFDSNVYSGMFESFTTEETADNPYVFSITFAFKVISQIRVNGV